MQALWSRAARTPSTCSCIQCVSSTRAVARRAGPVGIKGLWAIGTPTSTFFYTAIFAAGLAIDGRAKRKRNEQWDEAFALLRGEMAKPSQEAPGKQSQNPLDGIEDVLVEDETISSNPLFVPVEEVFPDGVDWGTIYRVAGTELMEDQVSQGRQSQVDLEHISDDLWELLQFDSRFPKTQTLSWPPNTGSDLVRHHLPPQSLWSLDHVRDKALRRRQTWKKLAIQELSMGLLIQSLLVTTRRLSLSTESLESLSPTLQDIIALDESKTICMRRNLQHAISSLESLPVESAEEDIIKAKALAANFPKPQYHQDNDGEFYSICQQMNAAMKRIASENGYKHNDDGEVALKLVKLAHNLLVSSAGPDVQTFNILISSLKRWGLASLVNHTIAALDTCKIRPNELTCAVILDHYIRTNRPTAFSRFVAKMRGVDDALMLALPDIAINEAGAARLVRVNEKKVYQKVHPTPLVFNTLMLGVLRFAGIERALEIYYEMKKDGWGLDVLGLTQFLVDCIGRSDWINGVYVWEEINNIKTKAKFSHMAKAYSNMLSLCSITGNSAAFNHVLKEVVDRRFNRREILNAAMSVTAKKRTEQWSATQPQVPVAPWIADNVLIATSGSNGSKEEKKPSNSVAPPEPDIDLTYGADTFPSFDSYTPPIQPDTETPLATDPEAAWSAWVKHELNIKQQSSAEAWDKKTKLAEPYRTAQQLHSQVSIDASLEEAGFGWLSDEDVAQDKK